MFTSRTLIAAILGGIAGTIANSVAITAATGTPLAPLIFSFGREAVAILVALLLIPIFARTVGAPAWITGFLVLTLIPSVLAKLVFAAAAPWSLAFLFNGIYAIVAIIVYVLITRRRNIV